MVETTPSTRVLARLRAALDDNKLSQRVLCERLERITGTRWSQSRLGKILTGRVELRVDDVTFICEAAGLSVVELMREHGREFVADLTPSELAMFNRLRGNALTLRIVESVIETLKREPTTGPPSRAEVRAQIRAVQKDVRGPSRPKSRR